FFQAEDGIRDFHVTGVQTCALPICARYKTRQYTYTVPDANSVTSDAPIASIPRHESLVDRGRSRRAGGLRHRQAAHRRPAGEVRSEERRVGKEWRTRWGR